MTAMTRVDILLSTYNGAAFLAEQINSIILQDHTDWRLIVRDDGSRDSTIEIIKSYVARDSRISIVESASGNLGPASSFLELMRHVESPLFMFADQDDVWEHTKIGRAVSALSEYHDVPALVFTDLAVVDADLKLLNASFMKLQRFDATAGMKFPRLLMQNVVTGCTLCGTRQLIVDSGLNARTLPPDIVMHDWWLALVACAFGKILYLDEPSILYRQHGGNCLGAKGSGLKRYATMLLHDRPWVRANTYLTRVSRQAGSFLSFYEGRFSQTQMRQLRRMSGLHSTRYTFFSVLACFARGMKMHALDRNVALLASSLLR